MSTGLHLTTFGELTIQNDDDTITGFPSRKVEALLVYLIVEVSAQRRESLFTLLWPGMPEKSARHNLRQVLYALRQTFPEVAARESDETVPLILTNRNTIQINPEALVDADFYQLDHLLRETQRHDHPDLSRCEHCIQSLEKVVDLYSGEFLRDFYLEDSNPFEDWVEAVRETYRHKILDALETLADIFIQNQASEQAFQYINQQLDIDHLRECAHRQRVEAYWLSGRRVEALRHYHQYSQLLREELDIDPSKEMKDLYKQIRTQSAPVQKPDFSIPDAGSPGSFPRHNLPHSLTSFIGRQEELDEIANLVVDHRLVTLTGAGGIGKTQLCLQVGRRLVKAFPDGVWLIELAPVTDPALVPQIVANALGLWESPSQSFFDQLLDFLQSKDCLLILDNCEHLIDAAAQFIHSVLQACSEVKIIATSRETLDVSGEWAFLVQPLSFPKDDQILSISGWEQFDAMRLFVERARQVFPDYQVIPENLVPMVQICQRLDGIPLALELAAARVKVLTVEQIASRLEDRFHLLTESSRTAPERQQTLRATVDWSWKLLSDIEQEIMPRLSVFAGGMDLTAVETICAGNGIDTGDILDLLTELVNKSMLIARREQGQETRYKLLETIRQYAREQLVKAGMEVKFRDRHLEYFKQMGEQAEAGLTGPDQVTWQNQVDRELDNIRVALGWALVNDVNTGLQLSVALWRFWRNRFVREGERWISQFLAYPDIVKPDIKAKALWARGRLNFTQLNFDLGRTLVKDSLALYLEIGDQWGIARCLLTLGYWGEKSLVLESLDIFKALGDKLGIADTLVYLGSFEGNRNYEQALVYLEESRLLYHELGNMVGVAHVLSLIGQLSIWKGDYEFGRLRLEESLAIHESLGLKRFSQLWMNLGNLYFRLGYYQQACSFLEKSISISQKNGKITQSYWAFAHLGYVFLHQGELVKARENFIHTMQQFKVGGNIIGVVYSLEGLASLAVNQRQMVKATRIIGWTDATRQTIQDPRPPIEQADVDQDIATIIEMIGEEAYAAAYAIGQSMTMEQAIELSIKDE